MIYARTSPQGPTCKSSDTDSDFIFTDEKVFHVASPVNMQNDEVYVPCNVKKHESAAEWLLHWLPTFYKSLMVWIAVSKMWRCSELLFVEPGVKVDGRYYSEVLLKRQNAASHASHCRQRVCVPTRQCTCTPGTWDCPAPAAADTGVHLARSVATKQSWYEPDRLNRISCGLM